jgi:hypothetical protein
MLPSGEIEAHEYSAYLLDSHLNLLLGVTLDLAICQVAAKSQVSMLSHDLEMT